MLVWADQENGGRGEGSEGYLIFKSLSGEGGGSEAYVAHVLRQACSLNIAGLQHI